MRGAHRVGMMAVPGVPDRRHVIDVHAETEGLHSGRPRMRPVYPMRVGYTMADPALVAAARDKARPTRPAWPRSRKERPRVSRRRRDLAGTHARANAVDAIVVHGFVRREVDADRDRPGLPDEPLPED